MDFKRLCEIRDAVMQIDQLSQQLQKENKHNGYKSPRIVKESRSTNLSNPTEAKALRMVQLAQQIEDKKNSIIPDLKQAAAYIDKHCSDMDAEDAYKALVRFNQAIALFMEYAFYNPETMVIITADHETGGLYLDENGEFQFVSADHTSANVPLFAYGAYADVFNGATIENVQIPKTIGALFGIEIEGTEPETYPALLPVREMENK